MSNFRSDYTLHIVSGVIAVQDLNQGGMSVTNDIENVITDLKRRGIDFSDKLFVYRDSEGFWDGVLVKDGKFGGFVIIGASSRDEAASIMRHTKEHTSL